MKPIVIGLLLIAASTVTACSGTAGGASIPIQLPSGPSEAEQAAQWLERLNVERNMSNDHAKAMQTACKDSGYTAGCIQAMKDYNASGAAIRTYLGQNPAPTCMVDAAQEYRDGSVESDRGLTLAIEAAEASDISRTLVASSVLQAAQKQLVTARTQLADVTCDGDPTALHAAQKDIRPSASEIAAVNQPASAAPTPTPTVPPAPPGKVGEAVKIGDVELMVTRTESPVPADRFIRPQDDHFARVHVQVTNVGTGPLDVSPFSFELRDTDGQGYDPSYLAPEGPKAPSGTVPDGEKLTGALSYDLPAGKTYRLYYQPTMFRGQQAIIDLGEL